MNSSRSHRAQLASHGLSVAIVGVTEEVRCPCVVARDQLRGIGAAAQERQGGLLLQIPQDSGGTVKRVQVAGGSKSGDLRAAVAVQVLHRQPSDSLKPTPSVTDRQGLSPAG